MSEHLDLDALADVLADDGAAPVHLTDCAQCRSALDELRDASAQVTADLAALPALIMPTDIAARLATDLHGTSKAPGAATVTTLPPAREPSRGAPSRWLPAAAAVLLLGGAGYGLSQLGGSDSTGSGTTESAGDTAAKSAPGLDVVRNSSGNDYSTRATLAAALPTLLAGTAGGPAAAQAPAAQAPAQAPPVGGTADSTAPNTTSKSLAVADPLARLRDDGGLADCLAALLPPEDPSARPLALDYASYKGAPALVVVLPSPLAGKLDIFVVGPGCSQANDNTLFYTSVDKP